MKYSLFFAVVLFLCFGSNYVGAEELKCTSTVIIPERYALTICSDVDPTTKFEKEAVLDSVNKSKEELKVEQLTTLFYAPGKKEGDGVLALAICGGYFSEGLFQTAEAENEERGKFLEMMAGYGIEPDELWQIYDNNEVVADEDFKGKPVLLLIKSSGVSKDFSGRPYLRVPVDEFGLRSLDIYLSKDDPLLRNIKKGQELGIRAFPKEFIMDSVKLDGEILFINDAK